LSFVAPFFDGAATLIRVVKHQTDQPFRNGAVNELYSAVAPVRVIVWWMVCVTVLVSSAESAEPDETAFFREKIEFVLKAKCYGCHSEKADKVQGGLRLDTSAGLVRGGDSGPAMVKGKSGASLLIQAIRHEGGL